jgi:hypothetical protein
MNVLEFLNINNIKLDGNHDKELFNNYYIAYHYSFNGKMCFMTFYKNGIYNFEITLSTLYDMITIELYKETSPYYDVIHTEKFNNLNVTNIEELINFCEKVLENKIFT